MDAIGQLAGRVDELAAAGPRRPALGRAARGVRRAAARRDRRLGAAGRRAARPDRGPRAARARPRAGRPPPRGLPDRARLRRRRRPGRRAKAPAGRRSSPRTCARCTGWRSRGVGEDAGAWRTRNLPPLADGTIPPPHWMVPFETETAVGRLALGEPTTGAARAGPRDRPLRAAAAVPERNGRVARLVANLLAYRRGLPPLVLDARARARLRRGAARRRRAATSTRWRAWSAGRWCAGSSGCATPPNRADELRPLAAFAGGRRAPTRSTKRPSAAGCASCGATAGCTRPQPGSRPTAGAGASRKLRRSARTAEHR